MSWYIMFLSTCICDGNFFLLQKLLTIGKKILWQKPILWQKLLFCDRTMFVWRKLGKTFFSVIETCFFKDFFSMTEICFWKILIYVTKISFCHEKFLFGYSDLFLWQKLVLSIWPFLGRGGGILHIISNEMFLWEMGFSVFSDNWANHFVEPWVGGPGQLIIVLYFFLPRFGQLLSNFVIFIVPKNSELLRP